ncbi:HU family DNA-binding protein [Afifella sp. IM 167]|uniref:HU family DNA-binding protein n=1 Tax=Afifella sp. IM 167 TaxID=2033586 RepID=UPI001CCD05DC|nr:HU family DNA-binding protein [Afifella sp. IM 167]MBZ8133952.1 hypothetical protein [Afifella sp. IM 167]
MNKKDLIAQVSQRTGLAPTIAGDVVDALLGQIHDALRAGETVRIQNFGTFTVKSRAARTGRNPRTGELLRVPASRTVGLIPSERMRAALAGDPTIPPPKKKKKRKGASSTN